MGQEVIHPKGAGVELIAKHRSDNRRITPEEAMRWALEDYAATPDGDKPDKCIIITLNNRNDDYHYQYHVSNMSDSEIAALLGAIQARVYAGLAGIGGG